MAKTTTPKEKPNGRPRPPKSHTNKPSRSFIQTSKNQAPSTTPPETIFSTRQLIGLLSDFSDASNLHHGFNSLRAFATNCRPAEGIEDAALKANQIIMKEWLESQIARNADGVVVEDSFSFVQKAWDFASQTNNHNLLFQIPSALAGLLRTTSEITEYNSEGSILCKVVVQHNMLRILQKCLVTARDRVVSPCLRLLTEVNRFANGMHCRLLYSNFDFTMKDIGKGLEVRRSDVQLTYDPYRQTTRTVYVRFILSFFIYGSTTIKNDMLGIKAVISPLFKFIRNDAPPVIGEILDVLEKKVVDDQDIPRKTKILVFNEWVLSHIASLYTRDQVIKDIGGEKKTVATAAHDFLMSICTKPGKAVCFQDSGWYPREITEDEEEEGVQRLYNRLLASFIRSLKPYSDVLQQDLLIAIFKACPELVNEYFSNEHVFSFDPKLTATWIGYCAFLTMVTELPIPEHLDTAIAEHKSPPQPSIVSQSILPQVITRSVANKCLTHECNLVRFAAVRLILASFKKMNAVIEKYDTVYREVGIVGANWEQKWFWSLQKVIPMYLERLPDLNTVVTAYNKMPVESVLLRESYARLIYHFYHDFRMVTEGQKFDVNVTLGKFFSEPNFGVDQPLRRMELAHLIYVSGWLKDNKWWSKPAGLKTSPVGLLMRFIVETKYSDLAQKAENVMIVLTSLFPVLQDITPMNPLTALLDSLRHLKGTEALLPVISLLEESMQRLVSKKPVKYEKEYLDIIGKPDGYDREAPSAPYIPPTSLLCLMLAEQWKFVAQSKNYSKEVKQNVAKWLSEFFELCGLCEENQQVLIELSRRLIEASGDIKSSKLVFRALEAEVRSWATLNPALLSSDISMAPAMGSGKRNVRDLLRQTGLLDVKGIKETIRETRMGNVIVTAFDVAFLHRVIPQMVLSERVDGLESITAIKGLMYLLKDLLLIIARKRERVYDEDAFLVITEDPLNTWWDLYLQIDKPSILPKVLAFTHGFSQILCLALRKPTDCPLRLIKRFNSLPNYTLDLEKGDAEKLAASIAPVLKSLIPVKDVKFTLTRLVEASRERSNNLGIWEAIGVIVRHIAEKSFNLPRECFSILTPVSLQSNTLALSFSEYFVKNLGQLRDLELIPESITFILQQGGSSAAHKQLADVLIKNRDDARMTAEIFLENTPSAIPTYIAPLLESVSEPVESTSQFGWKSTVPDDSKNRIAKHIGVIGSSLIAELPSRYAAETLRRAVCLCETDKSAILQQIANDRRRSTLTAWMVQLIEVLMSSRALRDDEPRAWLYCASDHLTRRFAEDDKLNATTLDFCDQTSALIKRTGLTIGDHVPRPVINALLEAALERHLHEEKVMALAARIIATSSVQTLDFAKLLQIILANEKRNPLSSREAGVVKMVHGYIAFIMSRLFNLGKIGQSNLATWDAILALYRGTTSAVDKSLLKIITFIEGRLSRSFAARISAWNFLDVAEVPLMHKQKTQIILTVDAKRLYRSVSRPIIERGEPQNKDIEDLDRFMDFVDIDVYHDSDFYDPHFMLPVLTFSIMNKAQLDVYTAIERNCLSYALTHLSSKSAGVRGMVVGFLNTLAHVTETTHSYREKTQMVHLISTILSSLEMCNIKEKPLPSIDSVFLAHVSRVVGNPTHFMYETVMTYLMERPTLHITDVPRLLNVLKIQGKDTDPLYWREAEWIVSTMFAGLRNKEDLRLYARRKVFEFIFAVYNSQHRTVRYREKSLELLWNTCEIPGGATCLIVGFYMHVWCRKQLWKDQTPSNRLDMMRLIMRMHRTANKNAIKKFYGFYELYEKDIRDAWSDYKDPITIKEKEKKLSNGEVIMKYYASREGKPLIPKSKAPDGSSKRHIGPDDEKDADSDSDSEEGTELSSGPVLDFTPKEPEDNLNRKVYIKIDEHTTMRVKPKKCTCQFDENGNKIKKWVPPVSREKLKEILAKIGLEDPEKFIQAKEALAAELKDYPQADPDWSDMVECHCGYYDPKALEQVAELVPSLWEYYGPNKKKDRRPVINIKPVDRELVDSFAREVKGEAEEKLRAKFAELGLNPIGDEKYTGDPSAFEKAREKSEGKVIMFNFKDASGEVIEGGAEMNEEKKEEKEKEEKKKEEKEKKEKVSRREGKEKSSKKEKKEKK